MKIFKIFVIYIILFFYVFKAHANLSNKGIEFFVNLCDRDNFYKTSLEIVRRYQSYQKTAMSLSYDKVVIGEIVKELLFKEDDESFLYRQKRNKIINNEEDKMKIKLIDLTFDIAQNSALTVFLEYRISGDDVRLKRRLHEACRNQVDKIINK